MKSLRKLQSIFIHAMPLLLFVQFCFLMPTHAAMPMGRNGENVPDLQTQNLLRSIQLVDKSVSTYFSGDEMTMARFYNPDTKEQSAERGSVWMYTASIEAVNAVLTSLKLQKENGNTILYDQHYNRYVDLLKKLFNNADYYLGTFTLTSFTQEKEWAVYAVDRVREKGKANVSGILNVYDDQMWLVRELLDAYHLTNDQIFLEKAEYLTAYVLDGWDSTLDDKNKEHGGIPWGPGYVTKHACSNGPMVSPLVWLHEIYKHKSDQIEHRYVDKKDKKSRRSKMVNKGDYYLSFAQKVYDWQKRYLLNNQGVYTDMMGDCSPDCTIAYENVHGTRYRANTFLKTAVGPSFSYNSGTMISGAADLYRVTKSKKYSEDGKSLSHASFQYFAKLGKQIPAYYTYESSGFNNWFNGILLRGFFNIYTYDKKAGSYMESFQKNLDYGYDHFLKDGFLPTDLLTGWNPDKNKNNLEGMFMFTYAAQYAILSQYELDKSK
ncbi:glycoside hydrolase family 76 protein [Sphingobacterium sp. KU25419]|nr:glycoside hydrolase family 76 protein [Sphingobacterium sp. KU25419]